MAKFILKGLSEIAAAFAIALCGKEALDSTNGVLMCIAYWVGIYCILDLHVYLTNYIKEL